MKTKKNKMPFYYGTMGTTVLALTLTIYLSLLVVMFSLMLFAMNMETLHSIFQFTEKESLVIIKAFKTIIYLVIFIIENSFIAIILLILYQFVFIKHFKVDNTVGANCIKYFFNRGYEIHVGKDADRIKHLKSNNIENKPIISKFNFLSIENTANRYRKKYNPNIDKYSDDKRVIYVQLVAERVNNALYKGVNAYIVAHTWNEVELFRSLSDVEEVRAKPIVGIGHSVSQQRSKTNKTIYPWQQIKKYYFTQKVYHFMIQPTEANKKILELFEKKEHAEKFVKEQDEIRKQRKTK